jgi:uncharacterized membrane protein YdbT with pleckstrin-like domain
MSQTYASGERELLAIRPHWIILLAPAVAAVALTATLVVVSTGLASLALTDPWALIAGWTVGVIYAAFLIRWTGRGLIAWLTTRYVFTNRRIVTRTGWITKRSESMSLSKVNSIEVTTTLFERWIGSGKLVVESAADNVVVITNVPDAAGLEQLLQQEIQRRDADD